MRLFQIFERIGRSRRLRLLLPESRPQHRLRCPFAKLLTGNPREKAPWYSSSLPRARWRAPVRGYFQARVRPEKPIASSET